MSIRRARERRFPRTGEVYLGEEADPRRFFDEPERSRKGNWKALQLCKQVERAVAVVLATECESEALLGAAVAAVEPAPDSGRLLVTVGLGAGREARHLAESREVLTRFAATFREEVARSIHRKRAPEIVFDVRLALEVDRG